MCLNIWEQRCPWMHWLLPTPSSFQHVGTPPRGVIKGPLHTLHWQHCQSKIRPVSTMLYTTVTQRMDVPGCPLHQWPVSSKACFSRLALSCTACPASSGATPVGDDSAIICAGMARSLKITTYKRENEWVSHLLCFNLPGEVKLVTMEISWNSFTAFCLSISKFSTCS